MAKKSGVSSKTHTQQQLNDYANQNNPNNKAYKARIANDKKTKRVSKKHDIASGRIAEMRRRSMSCIA
ncbi:hypothetical protein JYQ77_02730 [Anaerobutyricum soehngenii]|uniref:hypothetical protein n=1 Tax=Anaerobutyricum soehngenii TaxID=105843 RepID=UPI001ADD737A|nr:hypothetical protein [Anaerobutyricum soehngenii]MBP0059173.1 hypothetical protein [Anaerobutyricum soehngenii]